MSRLIIKGLPARFGDKELRNLCSFAGEVTDAKVIKTREGRSRQFGFVGFRTKKEGNSAKVRLDKSYVDTARVSVQLAHSVGDQTIPRPWSKYSDGSSRHERESGANEDNFRKQFLEREARRNEERRALKEKEIEKELSEKEKAALAEFAEVVEKRGSKPIWADGHLGVSQKSVMVASRKKGGEDTLLERKHVTFGAQDSDDEDDALYEELPEVAIQNDDEVETEAEAMPEEGDAVALNEEVSDMEYFKTKVVTAAAANDSQHDDRAEASGEQLPETSIHKNGRMQQGLDEDSGDASEKLRLDTEAGTERFSDGAAQREAGEPAVKQTVEHKTRHCKVEQIDAGETGRLLVRNLAYSMTEEELESVFEAYGTLSDVHILRDGQNGKSKGMAFVQYVIPENAPKALVSVDGTFQSGRIIHVLPAKPRPAAATRSFFDSRTASKPGGSTFKSAREDEQKDAARKGLDSSAQHAMHISPNAVAEIMADRHGVSKAELYGTTRGESGIAAVRLAMAEATIQGETRQFLLDNGIDMSVAEKANAATNAATAAGKRKRQSRTAFLAKNLPAKTKRAQLEDVFGGFGALRRLVVVPSGLLAVVEFSSPANAKRAYNSLAYTKFLEAPLYLEWLPLEALREIKPQAGDDATKQRDGEEEDEPVPNPALQGDAMSVAKSRLDSDGPEGQKSASVYVKNLNFDTRDESLKAHFTKLLRKRPALAKSLRSAKVAMKRAADGKTSERLSMGFGFLEFSTRSSAVEVVKLVQNSVLDGHTLQLRISNQQDETSRNQKRKKTAPKAKKVSPKLLVRNVAFEATRRDLRQLFSAFGQLKTVRMPKKMDGSHRGFGFVEFVSRSEAKAAFEALASAHLYGRHLVIEYADESSDTCASVGELQEKAAAQMAKKRIRTNDGTFASLPGDASKEMTFDQQDMLRDELYS